MIDRIEVVENKVVEGLEGCPVVCVEEKLIFEGALDVCKDDGVLDLVLKNSLHNFIS